MMKAEPFEETIVIMAPLANDALLASAVLEEAGHVTEICPDIDTLCGLRLEEYAVLLIAEEALLNADLNCIRTLITEQEPWSDIPVIVMTSGGAVTKENRHTIDLFTTLGNLTLLERPFRKITLLKSVQGSLTARRHQFKMRDLLAARERMLSSITDVYVAVDANGRITEVNQHAEEAFFHKQSDEVVGQSITDPSVIGIDGVFRRNIEQCLEKGEACHFEACISTTDRWFEVHSYPSEGGVALYIRDISDRKHSEIQLRESEERFRSTFENAAVGMAHIDLSGQWLRMNEKFCTIMGFSAAEQFTQSISSFIHSEDIPRERKCREHMLKHHTESQSIEVRCIRKDGSVIWVQMTISIDNGGGSGTPRYFIYVIEDISERKAAEAAVRELNSELEYRVKLRTAELIASNHELEQFSYSVSHDLRAPLRAISGYVSIVMEDSSEVSEELRGYLGKIKANALMMGKLVDALLDFSRLGRHPIKKMLAHPSEIVRDIIVESSELNEWNHAEFVIQDLPSIQADPLLLRQVFANLMLNAVKFSREAAHPRVEIGASLTANGVTYYVRDNGVGFDMGYYDKMFGVFERLHPAEEFEGTGIGLALCKRIVERHHGRIWAEGEVGKGATFYFMMPASSD